MIKYKEGYKYCILLYDNRNCFISESTSETINIIEGSELKLINNDLLHLSAKGRYYYNRVMKNYYNIRHANEKIVILKNMDCLSKREAIKILQ